MLRYEEYIVLKALRKGVFLLIPGDQDGGQRVSLGSTPWLSTSHLPAHDQIMVS